MKPLEVGRDGNEPSWGLCFIYLVARSRQCQKINVVSVKRIVQIDVLPLARAPHRKEPNVFGDLGSVFRVTRQHELRSFGELICANGI